jgi:hypothetical protein
MKIHQNGPKTNKRNGRKQPLSYLSPSTKGKRPLPGEVGPQACGDTAQAQPQTDQRRAVAGRCQPGGARPGGGQTPSTLASSPLPCGASSCSLMVVLGASPQNILSNQPFGCYKRRREPPHLTHNTSAKKKSPISIF